MINIGESRRRSLNLSSKDLSFYTRDMNFNTAPGDFKLFVGTNSQNVLETNFILN